MTTTKSYFAGLGMTGIVIGSVLVLLAFGTGLVAFDGGREVRGARAPLERVVVGKDARSAGGERAPKRPDASPAPATAVRPPVAAPPPAFTPGIKGGAEPARGRDPGRHSGHGHGGARVRTRHSLGGGAPVRVAAEDGGGASADGPPGHAKREAGAPPGSRPPSKVSGSVRSRPPSTVPGPLKEQAAEHGPGLGIGHGEGRVRKVAGGGVPSGLSP